MSFILPIALAKNRKTYLTDFIFDNQIDGGFTNSLNSNDVSYQATANALEMLKFFDLYEEPQLFGDLKANVNVSVLQDDLKDELSNILGNNEPSIYDIFYLVKSIDLLNASINSDQKNTIEQYISNAEQSGGGFGPTNVSQSANLISTRYCLSILELIDSETENEEGHKNFVLTCENSDGGFGGNASLDSTIANTYYGLEVLDNLGGLDEIADKEKTIEYLKDHYIDDEADENTYGGYLPDNEANYCLLSSTYYCIRSIFLLNEKKMTNETTADWVLSRQNFRDGGFVNFNGINDQEDSSVINTFYAFQILKTFDEDLLYLNENVWMIEFNWIVLIVLLSILGVVIALVIYYWQKRRF